MKPQNPLRVKNPMGGKILRYCGSALILIATSSGVFFSSTSNLYGAPQTQAGLMDKASVPEADQDEIRQMLSIAEAKHEIAKLRISQGRFDLVLPEIKKILELKLPDKYESAVAQSASLLANLLAESRQFGLAHEALNLALNRMKSNENKVSVLKIKAYVYRAEGKLDEALKCWERAVELEERRARP